jgi:hypothetical protein
MLPPTITYLGPAYPFEEARRQSRQAGARIDGQDRSDPQSRHPTPPRFEVQSVPSAAYEEQKGAQPNWDPAPHV